MKVQASRGYTTRDREARFAVIKRWSPSAPVLTPELADTKIGVEAPKKIFWFLNTGQQFQLVGLDSDLRA